MIGREPVKNDLESMVSERIVGDNLDQLINMRVL